jgi:hypothetical protein
MDGVGAIIISPTRELSVQIFDVLRKLGKHHSFSGGLLIGGRKDVETEKDCVNALNILVCTPGRLLQHMDETPLFDCSQLQVNAFYFLFIFNPHDIMHKRYRIKAKLPAVKTHKMWNSWITLKSVKVNVCLFLDIGYSNLRQSYEPAENRSSFIFMHLLYDIHIVTMDLLKVSMCLSLCEECGKVVLIFKPHTDFLDI